MIGVEFFRSVVGQGCFKHVTALERIVHTTADTLISRRQRLLNCSCSGAARFFLLFLSVDEHGSHLVSVVESAIVACTCLEIEERVGQTRCRSVTEVGITFHHVQQIVSIAELVVTLHRIVIRSVRTAALIGRIVLDRHLRIQRQTFGNERKLLVEFELGHDSVLETILITFHHFGIRVGHRSCTIFTEQGMTGEFEFIGLRTGQILRRIIFRELYWVTCHYVVEYYGSIRLIRINVAFEVGTSRVIGALIVLESRCHVHLQLGGLGDIDIDLGHDIETVYVDVVLEVVQTVVFQHTLIVGITAGYIIFYDLTTTADVYRIVLVVGEFVEHLVVPVHVRIGVVVESELRIEDFLRRIARRRIRVVVVHSLVVHVHVGDTVYRFGKFGRGRKTRLVTERHLGATFETLLGGYGDYTVGTLRSVQCGSRRVFQNGELLDVVGVDCRKVVGVDFESVQQNQRRLRITERGYASHEELGVVGARLTASLVGDKTRSTTGKSRGKVTRRYPQFLCGHCLDCGNDGLFLLSTESDHLHVFESSGAGNHLDYDFGFAADLDNLVFHTEVRNPKFVVISNCHFERTGCIGDGTFRRYQRHDLCTDKRLALFVQDFTRHFLLLLRHLCFGSGVRKRAFNGKQRAKTYAAETKNRFAQHSNAQIGVSFVHSDFRISYKNLCK